MGGISIWQLLIIFVIVVLLFGTKKLRTLGGDLGSAIKGFKKAVSEEDKNAISNAHDADFKTSEVADRTNQQDTVQSKSSEQQKQN